jgi:hypothetical protein
MIFKTVHTNNILAFALVPFILVALWLNALSAVYIPEALSEMNPMPLWGLILKVMKGNRIIASVIVLVMALLAMIGVNRFVNRFGLLSQQTAMPGILYIILLSGFTEVQQIQPVWFFVPLFLLTLERLFHAHGQQQPMSWCFDGAFWFSVGTLFYGKGIFLFPYVLIVMFILRVFSTRSVLAAIFGLVLPYLFVYGYYFAIDQQGVYFEILLENFVSPVAFFGHSLYSRIYMSLMVLLILFSLVSVVRRMQTFKILTRKHYRIFNWLVILTLLAAMTPFYSLEVIPIISIGSAILVAHFLDAMRSDFWREVFFTLIVAVTILAQLFV